MTRIYIRLQVFINSREFFQLLEPWAGSGLQHEASLSGWVFLVSIKYLAQDRIVVLMRCSCSWLVERGKAAERLLVKSYLLFLNLSDALSVSGSPVGKQARAKDGIPLSVFWVSSFKYIGSWCAIAISLNDKNLNSDIRVKPERSEK